MLVLEGESVCIFSVYVQLQCSNSGDELVSCLHVTDNLEKLTILNCMLLTDYNLNIKKLIAFPISLVKSSNSIFVQ